MNISTEILELTPYEYDQWKDKKLLTINNSYINDEEYINYNIEYFKKYENLIRIKYKKEDKVLMSPYGKKYIELFEKKNNIYLPIELKYYLTRISKSSSKHFLHIFNIFEESVKINEEEFLQPYLNYRLDDYQKL